MKPNYQLMLDEIINQLKKEEKVPTLLLHSCCGPCSSYVLEYLSNYFQITVYYYNPNIYPEEEFYRRVKEQQTLISLLPTKYPVSFIGRDYIPEHFYEIAKGLEKEKEGGKRCYECYYDRMKDTCKYAKEHGFDYFTTTLSISPYKNATWINEIGKNLEKEYQVSYLYSDFKKKNGYKRSIELSKKYNMYRQDYCGCVFSKTERMSKMSKNVLTKNM